MEGHFFPVYGPAWCRKKIAREMTTKHYISYKEFPLPDGLSNGPVIKKIKSIILEDSSCDENPTYCLARMKQLKNIKRPFPVQRAVECFLPFNNAVRTGVCSRISDCNSLNSFHINGSHYLIYISKNMSVKELRLAEISNIDYSYKSRFLYELKHEKLIKQYENILQIDAQKIGCEGYILVMTESDIHMHTFNNSELIGRVSMVNPQSISLHSVLKGYFSTTSLASKVSVYDIERTGPVWCGSFSETESDKIFDSHFGNHPLCLYVTSNSKVCLVDIRLSSSNVSRKIFDMKERNKYLRSDESVYSSKGISDLPYIFVNCSESIILMDNRYCKIPVLTWNHMMLNHPRFPALCVDRENSIYSLVMADHKNCSFCMVPIKCSGCFSTEPLRIEGISTPKHFNIIKDTFSYAHTNGLWHEEEVYKSLYNQQLDGMTVVSFPQKKHSLICFQNTQGILFYQCMTSRGAALYNFDDVEPVLKKYEKGLREPILTDNRKTLQRREAQTLDGIPEHYSIYQHFVTDYPNFTGPVWDVNYVIQRKPRQTYGFESDTIAKKAIKDKPEISVIDLLPEAYRKTFDIETLNKSADDTSRKLLSHWTKSFDKKTHKFKRHPFGIKDELSSDNNPSDDSDDAVEVKIEGHHQEKLMNEVSKIEPPNWRNHKKSLRVREGF